MPKEKVVSRIVKNSPCKDEMIWEWNNISREEHLTIDLFDGCEENTNASYLTKCRHKRIPCFDNVSLFKLCCWGNVDICKKTRNKILEGDNDGSPEKRCSCEKILVCIEKVANECKYCNRDKSSEMHIMFPFLDKFFLYFFLVTSRIDHSVSCMDM